MQGFCQIFFGAETEEKAKKIIDALFEAKLIACADSFPINANYYWKGAIQRENRVQIIAYSMFKLKDEIISKITQNHTDEVPAIVFTEITVNQEYLDWIEESVKRKV